MKSVPLSALVALLLSATLSEAANLGCGISSFFASPKIQFGEISDGIVISNFGDTWKFGVTAVVSGNGKSTTFAHNLDYKKVGERIEIKGDDYIILSSITIEQFQNEFGLFPEVVCTTP